MFQFDKFKPR